MIAIKTGGNGAMKEITFQFVTGKEAASELIRWKTDSEISHVNVVTPEGKLLGALMNGGIQVREANYDHWTLQILVTIPVTDEQYDEFWKYALSQVGGKYDSKGIMGIALGNNMHDPKESFCSEYMTKCINAGKVFRIAKDPSKIDPETLRLLVTSRDGAAEKRIQ